MSLYPVTISLPAIVSWFATSGFQSEVPSADHSIR